MLNTKTYAKKKYLFYACCSAYAQRQVSLNPSIRQPIKRLYRICKATVYMILV